MTRHHLTDTEILALHFDTQPDGNVHEHVSSCATCQARGYAVTSLVQTVMDSVVRLELPEAVAVADTVLGSRRQEGQGLTRMDLQQVKRRGVWRQS